MPIKLPVEVAFYYEATDIRDRLLLCIPKEELVRMVSNQKADNDILEDYPDGIDIKVSSLHFADLNKKYKLTLTENPDEIITAFEFLRFHTRRRKFPKTGFINKHYLIELSAYLQAHLENGYWKNGAQEDISILKNTKSQKGVLKRKYKKDIDLNRAFRKLELLEYDPKKSIKEQRFSMVEMSEGEEPFAFVSKIKQKK